MVVLEVMMMLMMNDENDEKIQNYKQGLIDKNILHKGGVKKFDKIVDKWKQTKNKKNCL